MNDRRRAADIRRFRRVAMGRSARLAGIAAGLGVGLVAFGGGAVGQTAPAKPAHIALVIGAAAYAGLPALPGCDASAHAVAAALSAAGFGVLERHDLTNGEQNAVVAEYLAALAGAPQDVGLIYFCGYAVNYGGRTFLLPVSATLEREADALTQGVLAASLPNGIGRTGAHGLVLLDLVPAPKAAPFTLDALAQAVTAPDVAMAAGLGAAPHGTSPFAQALTGALAPPPLDTGGLLARLAQGLSRSSGTRLWEHKAAAPIPLVAAAAPAAAPSAPPAPPAASPPAPPAAPPAASPPAPPAAPPSGPASGPPATPAPPPAVTTPAAPPPAPPAAAPVTPAPVTPAPVTPAPATHAPSAPAPPRTGKATAPDYYPPSAPPPPPASPEEALTEAQRRHVQAVLSELGYYPGRIDGRFGIDTRAAIRRYQSEIGAPATGTLTREQARRLLVHARR